MSARPTRPPATLPLTPAQLRIARKVADGESTDTIASELSITVGTISVQLQHCGQKLGVSGRAAVVHACFVTEQLQRPETAACAEAFSDANDPHLVTLGWSCEVLDESLTEMASGTILRVPTRR